jgi:hypothetical protein
VRESVELGLRHVGGFLEREVGSGRPELLERVGSFRHAGHSVF